MSHEEEPKDPKVKGDIIERGRGKISDTIQALEASRLAMVKAAKELNALCEEEQPSGLYQELLKNYAKLLDKIPEVLTELEKELDQLKESE